MTDEAKQNGDQAQTDDVSQIQAKLETLSVSFQTIGIIPRDAPPSARGPEEAHKAKADDAARAELSTRTKQFARDIVRCSRDIDAMLAAMQAKAAAADGRERQLLETANFDSAQAGDDMTDAIDDANKLLASVHGLIAAREMEA